MKKLVYEECYLNEKAVYEESYLNEKAVYEESCMDETNVSIGKVKKAILLKQFEWQSCFHSKVFKWRN